MAGPQPQNSLMVEKRLRRRLMLAAAVAFSLWCWQVFWWRHEAPRITLLEAKALVGLISIDERLEWGAICNGLGDYQCAVRVFSGVVAKQPKHRLGLANLAIAEARQGLCRQAFHAFNRYHSLGAEGPEVLYWRGQCLAHEKLNTQAIAAFYLSTAISPEATKAPEQLMDLLVAEGRSEEALSILGSLTQGKPVINERWRSKFNAMVLQLHWREAQVGEAVDFGKRAIHIPNLDGQGYWLPVRYVANGPVEFVMVDPDQAQFVVDEDQLMNVTFAKGDGSPSAPSRSTAEQGETRYKLSAMQIGSWVFRDVEFKVCRGCHSTMGRSVLENLEVSEELASGINFLTLTAN